MTPPGPAGRPGGPRHRVAVLPAGAVLAAALAVLVAAPASATDGPEMLLSSDGVHFTRGQAPVIFRSLSGMVPGESRPGSVWVRNGGTEPAEIALAVKSVGGIDVLTESLDLVAGSRGNGSATVPLPSPGSCRSVFQGWGLAPGETKRLDLALGMDASASNATRRDSASVQLVFLMRGTGGPATAAACPAPGAPADRNTVRQAVPAGIIAEDPAPGSAAHQAAAGTSGVEPQDGPSAERATHSNVEGNDQRPAQLLMFVAGLLLFAALRTRRRNS
ncbi:hypothetical protein [Arthrobacter wenxiniae]|uniref:Uncharacterized protein n=1 Tax=Arthrobacter wenxiniae TaxID=2713570 RepID=A0A7Y7LXZ0_9MICC|nr:hypothetical protein [Arthrobacter wenxiniae]NVM94387.1 hypothetical protein [Arthrobacter wenxiniae]